MKKMNTSPRQACLLLLCCFYYFSLFAQERTLGLLQYEAETSEGYTLFRPLFTGNTFLIDNCGRVVNEWESDWAFGTSVYLRQDGALLRPSLSTPGVNPVFQVGGVMDRVELVDWDGTVLWDFVYSDSMRMLHHDVEPMPNGNILILAWDLRTYEEAIAAGRRTDLLPDSVIFSEHIIEVDPSTDSIVWEWYLWDHLVQDYDTSKANYGEVGRHPERLDINFTAGPTADGGDDWLHLNSIDYNPDRDEIMINSAFLGEFYVIDHSTTTEEAAGSSGGQWNSGGDFLYRWGNPQVYDQGTPEDQQLFFAHDAHWIPIDLPGGGNIMVFNNGNADRPYSSVDILEPPVDSYLSGSYVYVPNNPFLPRRPAYTYTTDPAEEFFSSFISGAQRLPSGNTLICSGAQGRIFEINPEEEIVWEYINPEINTGPLAYDVDEIPIANGRNANVVFRATRYPVDYPGLAGRDLTPGDPIETGFPEPYDCQLLTGVELVAPADLRIYPVPAREELIIESAELDGRQLRLFDALGRLLLSQRMQGAQWRLDVSGWAPGVYFLQGELGWGKRIVVH